MNVTELVWAVGRMTVAPAVRAVAPMREYGTERVPREGGLVLAFNHFSWVDPPAFGASSPRTVYYVAKIEAHTVPGLGQLIRAFGTRSVRRGESDREAVRAMREIVREGHALGMFVEGTRQRRGVPGEAKPGAAMVALQEKVPVVPAAIHGSQYWRLGNFHPVSIAWGEPMEFDGLPRSGKGYKEATKLIQEEIHRLWRFLVDVHELGRPEVAIPPP
ncbi:MAG TPA: lysophospholipid acyltransferase family protein [Gaiellaceae bacterium]|jgi:1-acyl-sn-glycerol-3-phosphate acyltransferase|nr:lysophospholipid acyltransferase family protein [Gaiellaceae bacterium]